MEAANIEIKQRKQYFSQLSFQVLHFPFLVFALITLIILSTDSHFVAVGVSVISSWSLAWFETAQTWVNASIVYREKMAVIFLLYLVLCLYIFMVTVIALWRNRASFPIGFLPPMRIDCRNVLPSLLALVFFGFFIYIAAFSQIFNGSDVWLDSLNESNHKLGIGWLVSIEAQWNIKWTFLLTRWIQMIVVWSCSMGFLQHLTVFKCCLDNKNQ